MTATVADPDLRARIQELEHAVRFNLPLLRAVHDDPCKPAQRALLADVIDNLTSAAANNGSNP